MLRAGLAVSQQLTIYISCAHPIEEAARYLIKGLTDLALEDGIGLEVRARMGEVH